MLDQWVVVMICSRKMMHHIPKITASGSSDRACHSIRFCGLVRLGTQLVKPLALRLAYARRVPPFFSQSQGHPPFPSPAGLRETHLKVPTC